MIAMNYENEKQAFLSYADRFDRTNGMIELKVVHTLRVAEVMDRLTAALRLPDETRYLAALCAIFHDIGRFEQVKRFGTFNDRLSINHALLSCEIVHEGAFLSHLPASQQQMVLTAIENHNKLAISPDVTGETLLLSRLIRDADKIDIFRVFACEDMADTMGEPIPQVEQEYITDVVYDHFMRHECVPKSLRRTGLDIWIGFLGFFYDMNFPESIAIAREEGYYRRQFDTATFTHPETRTRISSILEELETFISQ